MSLLDRIRQRQLEEQTAQPVTPGQDQKKERERQKKDDVFNELKAKIHMRLLGLLDLTRLTGSLRGCDPRGLAPRGRDDPDGREDTAPRA